MSPRNADTYNCERMIVDMGATDGRICPCANDTQHAMVMAALADLDAHLSNPVYGHLVWAYLSQFTPSHLKRVLQTGELP